MTRTYAFIIAFILLFSLAQTYLLRDDSFYQPTLITVNGKL